METALSNEEAIHLPLADTPHPLLLLIRKAQKEHKESGEVINDNLKSVPYELVKGQMAKANFPQETIDFFDNKLQGVFNEAMPATRKAASN